MANRKLTPKQREARRRQVLRLRIKGLSLRAVGEEIGWSHPVVMRDEAEMLRELREDEPEVRTWRNFQVRRYERLLAETWKAIDNTDDLKVKIQAVSSAGRLLRRIDRLLGLEVPVRHQVEGRVTVGKAIEVPDRPMAEWTEDELDRFIAEGDEAIAEGNGRLQIADGEG